MSKVEIDVTAKTGQAEKALADLTRDVDKLQRKANEIGKGTSRSGSTRKGVPVTEKQTVSGNRGGATGKVDLSGLNSAFSSLTSQMGAFGQNLNAATNGISSFVENLAFARLAFQGLGKKIGAAYNIGKKARLERSPAVRAVDSELRRAHEQNRARRQFVQDAVHARNGYVWSASSQGRLRAYQGRLNAREQAFQVADSYRRYGPQGGKTTPQQYINRGREQFRQAAPWSRPAMGPRFLGLAGHQPGMLRGIGNIARGGFGKYVAAPLAGLGAGLRAGIGGISSMAGPLGGVIGSAAGIAAAGAVGASPLLYAGAQVAEGRQKAEELEGLNSQLSLLAKNLTGSSGDATALAEAIQKLGVDGAVPVEQLAQGAQMLMLAFKGNQTETAKWTNILADMSAGTGQSVEYFAEMITKANQFGSVEFEVFNQLNEKGIPIIEQLEGKFGDTREEIMKAAQAGEITAEEFMKAFEAAHKASMEGANAAKQVATLSGLQQQTRELEELEAANYTRGYDREMMEYERERNERARRRAEDESLAAGGEILGAVVGDLVSGFKSLVDAVGDATDALFGWYADVTGATDSQGRLNISEMDLYATTSRVISSGVNSFKKEGEEGYYYSAAELSEGIEQLERNLTRLRRIQNDDDFDDETRKYAGEAAARTEEVLNEMKGSYSSAVQRERTQQRQQEAEAVLQAYNQSKAKTEYDILEANGFTVLDEVYSEINELEGKIERGEGTRADLSRLEKLEKLVEEILKLREEENQKEEEAANERKRAEEEAAREAAEKAREEARKAQEERAREMYRMEHQIGMDPDNAELKLNYEFEQLADKLKNLGFSQDEADQMMTEKRANEIEVRERSMAENQKKIDEEKQAIEDNKKTGIEGIENAWGSVQRTMTSFTSPYEQDQLKELEGINDKLQEEIDALNRLDIRARAQ